MTSSSKALKSLLKRELLLTVYNIRDVVFALLTSLLIFFIFLLIFKHDILSEGEVLYGIIVIITTLTIGFHDYFQIQNDFQSGILEQNFLLPVTPLYFIIMKWVIAICRYLFIHITLWSVLCYTFIDTSFFNFIVPYCCLVIHLISVVLLITSISLNFEHYHKVIFTTLSIVMIFPQIVLSILSITNSTYIFLALGLSVLLVPMFLFFSTIMIQNAISESC